MKPRVKLQAEFNILLSAREVHGIVNVELTNFEASNVKFRISSAIVINSIKCDQKEVFYSRAPDNYSDNGANLTIFLPVGLRNLIWSPIPQIDSKTRRNYCLKIDFTLNSQNPSLYWSNNFCFTNNHPFGAAGWLPICVDEVNPVYEQISISADTKTAAIFGPSKEFTTLDEGNRIIYKYNTSQDQNYDFYGWAAGVLNKVTVNCFECYSIDNMNIAKLDFLKNFSSNVIKDRYPFIFIDDLFTDMILSNSYCIISTNLLLSYSSFKSFIPIPPIYHAVAAVSHAIAFNEYGRGIIFPEKLTWFYVGVICYAGNNYIQSVLGSNEFDAYNWAQLRYLYIVGEITPNPLIFRPFHWSVSSHHQIQAQFTVNALFTHIDTNKVNEFIRNIPRDLTYSALNNYLSQIVENPSKFIDFWITPRILPVLKLSMDYAINKAYKSLATVEMTTTPIKTHFKTMSHVAVSVVFYTQTCGYVEDVSLPLHEEAKTSINFHKKRNRKLLTSNSPTPVDSIIFGLIESSPHVPVIFLYDINPVFLVNIVKSYKSSVFAQHEALSSLHRYLLSCGDEGNEILKYFKEALYDLQTFFSLKCHILKILADIIVQEQYNVLKDPARGIFTEFFTHKITAQGSLCLQDVQDLHSCVVIAAFEGMARLGIVTEKFSSFQFLMNAVLQVSGTTFEPYFIELLGSVALLNKSEWRNLSSFLLELITDSEDHHLQVIAINAYERFSYNTQEDLREDFTSTLIDNLQNRTLNTNVRQAMARLIIRLSPNVAAIAMLVVVYEELSSGNADYIFIERVFSFLVFALPTWGEFAKKNTREHSNMTDLFEYIRTTMALTSQSYLLIAAKCSDLYQMLFEKRWRISAIPDGIIKSTKIDYSSHFDEGMFSDDDD